MEPIYSQKFTVSHTDTDAFGRLKLSAMLGYMQEAAGRHFSNPKEYDNLVWVISRNVVEITRLPHAEETITLETWAVPASRVAFPRGTIAYDEKGQELFRSMSLWVLIDINSRAMVLPGKVNLPMVTNVRGLELPTPTFIPVRCYETRETRTVRFSQLDTNFHMNNTRYLDWVMDLLPLDFHRRERMKAFTICYVTEATLGEKVELSYLLEGNRLHVEGRSGDKRVFAVQAEFEPCE